MRRYVGLSAVVATVVAILSCLVPGNLAFASPQDAPRASLAGSPAGSFYSYDLGFDNARSSLASIRRATTLDTSGRARSAMSGRASPSPVASGVGAETASTADQAAYDYATQADKLDHIFAAKHNFDPLVQQFGSREAVVQQMLNGLKGLTPATGTFEQTIQIGGQQVVVRGAVVNGVVKIGTAFTP